MKKKSIFLIVIIFVILLLLALFCLWFFKWRITGNDTTNSSDTKKPYLELTVKEYPSRIDTICQRVEFVLTAKNTGNGSLKFTEIESGEYVFAFVRDETKGVVATTEGGTSGVHNLYVEDFGEIKTGQTKELNLYMQESYIGGADFGYQNGFNMLQSYGNVVSSYIFEFEKNNGGNSYTIYGNVPKIDIDIQAFEYAYGYWSNKICN